MAYCNEVCIWFWSQIKGLFYCFYWESGLFSHAWTPWVSNCCCRAHNVTTDWCAFCKLQSSMLSIHSMAHWECNHCRISGFGVWLQFVLPFTHKHKHNHPHGCHGFQVLSCCSNWLLSHHLALALLSPWVTVELTIHVFNGLHILHICIIDWACFFTLPKKKQATGCLLLAVGPWQGFVVGN